MPAELLLLIFQPEYGENRDKQWFYPCYSVLRISQISKSQYPIQPCYI